MLRKMYLVSPYYLNKKGRPSQLSTKPRKATRSIKHKTRKKNHPYDKWIVTRAKIEEATSGLKALMKAIADFVKAVLPETTKVPLPKIESSVQTASSSSSPSISRRHLPKLSGEEEEEGEAFETKPDDDVKGEVSEGDVHAYARKSFGNVANPYVAPFVHKKDVLDVDYVLRKVGDQFYVGFSI